MAGRAHAGLCCALKIFVVYFQAQRKVLAEGWWAVDEYSWVVTWAYSAQGQHGDGLKPRPEKRITRWHAYLWHDHHAPPPVTLLLLWSFVAISWRSYHLSPSLPTLISSKSIAPWSDLVHRGWDRSNKARPSLYFVLIGRSRGKLGASHRTRFRWNEVKWDKYIRSSLHRWCDMARCTQLNRFLVCKARIPRHRHRHPREDPRRHVRYARLPEVIPVASWTGKSPDTPTS